MTFLASMEEYQEDCHAMDVDVLIRKNDIMQAYSVMTGKSIFCEKMEEGVRLHIDCIRDFEMVLLS